MLTRACLMPFRGSKLLVLPTWLARIFIETTLQLFLSSVSKWESHLPFGAALAARLAILERFCNLLSPGALAPPKSRPGGYHHRDRPFRLLCLLPILRRELTSSSPCLSHFLCRGHLGSMLLILSRLPTYR